MGTKPGRLLLIKRSATPDGSGAKVPVCGIRTRSLSINNAVVDTTLPDCDNPALPIVETGKPGRQTLRFSGDGLFDDDDVGKLVADDARLQRVVDYEITWPGYGKWVGPFMVGGYEGSGDMDEELAFSAEWIPTSPPVFTAEVVAP